MPWPNKLAHKLTAQFFSIEYSEDARRLLLEDLKIEEMIFFNPSATAAVQRITATMVAAQILKHFDMLNIDLEESGDLDAALTQLIDVCTDGSRESVEIGKVVDTHFRFVDES